MHCASHILIFWYHPIRYHSIRFFCSSLQCDASLIILSNFILHGNLLVPELISFHKPFLTWNSKGHGIYCGNRTYRFSHCDGWLFFLLSTPALCKGWHQALHFEVSATVRLILPQFHSFTFFWIARTLFTAASDSLQWTVPEGFL